MSGSAIDGTSLDSSTLWIRWPCFGNRFRALVSILLEGISLEYEGRSPELDPELETVPFQ